MHLSLRVFVSNLEGYMLLPVNYSLSPCWILLSNDDLYLLLKYYSKKFERVSAILEGLKGLNRASYGIIRLRHMY